MRDADRGSATRTAAPIRRRYGPCRAPEHVGAAGADAHQHGLQSALEVQPTAVGLVRAGFAFCLASDGHPVSREHTLQLGFHLLLRAGASSAQASG